MGKTQVIAGLEIGRNRISMVAAEAGAGGFDIIFASKKRCADGMKNGAIINLEAVTESIAALTEEARQKSQAGINSVFVNISGPHIESEVVESVITLPQRGCEIMPKHVKDLINSCKIISVPMERSLLYLLPLEYIVDGQERIKEPVGLCGTRLEARILIVTAPFNQVQNIIKAVNFAGLETDEVVPTALANSYSLIAGEDKKDGVLLIDLKTDFTELAVMKEGKLLFFKAIPRGQQDITNEIAAKLNLPLEIAEDLKIKYGFLSNNPQDGRNQALIPLEWMGRADRIGRGEINKLISEQLGVIFNSISDEIKGLKDFNNLVKRGALISGDGIDMEGILEWAEERLGFAARAGTPNENLGSDYLTALGLLKFGLNERLKNSRRAEKKFFKRLLQKSSEILSDYF